MLELIKEIVYYARRRRRYLILPPVVVLLLFGFIFVLVNGSALAPLIYTIF